MLNWAEAALPPQVVVEVSLQAVAEEAPQVAVAEEVALPRAAVAAAGLFRRGSLGASIQELRQESCQESHQESRGRIAEMSDPAAMSAAITRARTTIRFRSITAAA